MKWSLLKFLILLIWLTSSYGCESDGKRNSASGFHREKEFWAFAESLPINFEVEDTVHIVLIPPSLCVGCVKNSEMCINQFAESAQVYVLYSEISNPLISNKNRGKWISYDGKKLEKYGLSFPYSISLAIVQKAIVKFEVEL